MTTPLIITTAITGAIPRKVDNPAVPVTPSEQIESTHEAFEAGSALVHVHVRDNQENPSSDPELFRQVKEGVEKHCPGMIIQLSTGGRGREPTERGAMLHLSPDMASLATGSVNFPKQIYENPPEFIDALAADMDKYGVKPEIEVFDAAMLYNAVNYAKRGQIGSPLHVQFVLGITNALPARRPLLEFLVSELRELMPDATWSALGTSRFQFEVNKWCMELGGHTRTGFEDNLKIGKDRLASSNAELVKLVVDAAPEYNRSIAGPAEARAILGLRPIAA
ncbi:MAG: 3-keto-5-aminohexanoate cleavage enzyme [Hyphomicrobiaceae bacterium]|jgi:3-keto-5-aminohexanoate cleavage enzyme